MPVEKLPQQDIYGHNPRSEVAKFVPHDVRSVLEVGCGSGGFGGTLREILGADARLVGIDAVESQIEIARQHSAFDEVIAGYFPEAFAERNERFDLIVFNDVLEHIFDPWSVVDQCREFLTPGGRILATIPNIQYAPQLVQLARGRWDYTDWGLLDRTHVRFFTRATMTEMFVDAGYEIEGIHGINSCWTWSKDPRIAQRLVKRMILKRLPDSRYLQFVVIARLPESP